MPRFPKRLREFVDWGPLPPTLGEIATSRESIGFVADPKPTPALGAYADTVRRLRDKAEVVRLRLARHDRVADWHFSRNRFEEYGFVELVLRATALRETAPELVHGIELDHTGDNATSEAGFETLSPFKLGGTLAAELAWGGPYEQFAGSAREMYQLGTAVSEELIGDDFDAFNVWRNGSAWSDWFCDVAWDSTYLLLDGRDMSVTLIAMTATD